MYTQQNENAIFLLILLFVLVLFITVGVSQNKKSEPKKKDNFYTKALKYYRKYKTIKGLFG